MRIYLASGFNRRYHLRALAEELVNLGHEVCSRWIWIEERPERDADSWHEFARGIALTNLIDLQQAESVIVDGRGIKETNNGGANFEFGFAVGKDLPVYIVGEIRNTFSHLDNIIKVDDYHALLNLMKVQYGIQSGTESLGIDQSHSEPRQF